MKPPIWIWFIGGLAMSSLVTASTQSMIAASRAGDVKREVMSLQREVEKLRKSIEAGQP